MALVVKKGESHLVMSHFLWPHGLYSSWNSPGHYDGVGSHFLLQGIFPTQECNWGVLQCGRMLYQLSPKGNPRILEWVGYIFSSSSAQPRNGTGVSCIAGRFFANWAIREVLWPACQCRRHKRHRLNPWVRKIPWRRDRLATPLFWPGEFHELYSPRGPKESDATEQLSLHYGGFNLHFPYG